MPPRTLKAFTFGCRVNQYETEYLRQGFEKLGYRTAGNGEPPDLCIVNSCAVTAESEAKCRKLVRRLAKAYPATEIILLGCYVARAPAEIAKLPNVAQIVSDKSVLPQLLAERGLGEPPPGIGEFPGRRRAYVKVQDGCQARCSYCIVPIVRPKLISRPAKEVLCEVHCLLTRGHCEIVLTGVHLGQYGLDCQSGATPNLAELVRQITDLEGDFRVRLSSIEAFEVSPELLRLMAARPTRICPHLHLPLQSGSDAVLRRMNRPGSVRDFMERCREIQARLDMPTLSTDVMVGFPGETEADFLATCRVVEEIGFGRLHVFRFSPRPGTPAAEMPGRITQRTVQERAEHLISLGKGLAERWMERFLGRRMRVLVESPPSGQADWLSGTSDHYLPVAFPGESTLIGRFAYVLPRRLENGCLQGELCQDVLSCPSYGVPQQQND